MSSVTDAVTVRGWCRMYGCGEEPAEGSEFCSGHQHAANEKPPEAEPTVTADGAESDGSAPSTPRMKWTRETVIAAIQDWAAEHGRAPTQRDWPRSGDGHPTFSTAAKYCGGWGAALEAAGFDGSGGRTRHGSAAARHEEPHEGSERGPQAKSSAGSVGAERPASPHTGAAAGPASRSDVLLRAVALAARAFADAILEETAR